jgi:hypothetical protein
MAGIPRDYSWDSPFTQLHPADIPWLPAVARLSDAPTPIDRCKVAVGEPQCREDWMRTKTIGATYLLIGGTIAAFVAVLVAVVRTTPASARIVQGAAADLLQPVVALVVLTAIVALMMVVYRNLALIRGAVSARYFRTFTADQSAEWVERPTRTYMNLLELPVLFYVVCVLMLKTGKFDPVQVSLAWVFVITRYVHAFIYIGFNYVPLRFAAFLSGVLALAVIWVRFAAQNLN